ncbi:hypothetical protein JCGZ_07075 [Jatropha curcas]|uniref:Uncharacterized protein n=1 Tax=Jatropha curcas TaxID=180498 RepID=A0A067KNW8_JATCU|nr:hypothetical protein JCGZ_07075 [Jatropha curcas]
MLKRVAVNSIDEEARFRLKHRSLLQEFLELQKEFVSKKKKLQITKQKRDILSAEVEFLRHRCEYLMDIQSHLQPEQDLVAPQNSFMQNEKAGKLVRAEKTKNPKNGVVNGKKVKKKISWQDQSTVMRD